MEATARTASCGQPQLNPKLERRKFMIQALGKWCYVLGHCMELTCARDHMEVVGRVVVIIGLTIVLWPLWKARKENVH
jgi:hypothetical protein